MLATILSLLGALLIIALIVGVGFVIWQKKSKGQVFIWKVKSDAGNQTQITQQNEADQAVKQEEMKLALSEEPTLSTETEKTMERLDVLEFFDQALNQEMILEEIPTKIYNVGKSGKIYTEEELELLIKE